MRGDFPHTALDHQLAARTPGARPEVDHVIRLRDDLRCVLDDHERVAVVADRAQHVDQPIHVSRVETDRRLVEHIEGARKAPAQSRRELDPLGLSSR